MLTENIDFYINGDGNFVFTNAYHLKRGYCCKNKCFHCPWGFGRKPFSEQEKHRNNNSSDAPGDQ